MLPVTEVDSVNSSSSVVARVVERLRSNGWEDLAELSVEVGVSSNPLDGRFRLIDWYCRKALLAVVTVGDSTSFSGNFVDVGVNLNAGR